MNTAFIRDWWHALRRYPVRALGLALVPLFLWLLQIFAEGEAYDAERNWLAARSDTAMWILHLIAAHWWWVGWFLIPLTIIGILVWAALDARNARRANFKPIGTLADDQLLDLVVRWLTRRLSDRKLYVASGTLFGSITHNHFPTSDVDVIIFFEKLTKRKQASISRKLRLEVAKEFMQTFGHPLHLQFYSSHEEKPMNRFIDKQSNPIALTLEVHK